MIKELLSAIAILLTIAAFLPYIRSIKLGKTKPHMFSWFIWGSTTCVVAFAQLSDKAGVGAWPILFSGVVTLYITFLAYTTKSDLTITKTDWVFLLSALFSLPLWYLTSDPLWAVIILTIVDGFGFGPTFRKAYNLPFEENLLFFIIVAIRNLVAIAALEHFSLTTILFPAILSGLCVMFVLMVTGRRKILKK